LKDFHVRSYIGPLRNTGKSFTLGPRNIRPHRKTGRSSTLSPISDHTKRANSPVPHSVFRLFVIYRIKLVSRVDNSEEIFQRRNLLELSRKFGVVTQCPTELLFSCIYFRPEEVVSEMRGNSHFYLRLQFVLALNLMD